MATIHIAFPYFINKKRVIWRFFYAMLLFFYAMGMTY